MTRPTTRISRRPLIAALIALAWTGSLAACEREGHTIDVLARVSPPETGQQDPPATPTQPTIVNDLGWSITLLEFQLAVGEIELITCKDDERVPLVTDHAQIALDLLDASDRGDLHLAGHDDLDRGKYCALAIHHRSPVSMDGAPTWAASSDMADPITGGSIFLSAHATKEGKSKRSIEMVFPGTFEVRVDLAKLDDGEAFAIPVRDASAVLTVQYPLAHLLDGVDFSAGVSDDATMQTAIQTAIRKHTRVAIDNSI